MNRLALLALIAACRAPADDVVTDPGDSGDSGDTGTPADDPRFDALVAAIEADLEASLATGASVAIWEDGVVTWARGFGSAHPDQDVAVTTDTLFQIGSTTKMMTATSLLQRVQAGDVALDDTLAAALPELVFANDPTWSDQVRVEHLISHRGAFYDSIDWDATADDGDLAAFTYGDFADTWFLMNPPGAFWNYANPNFTLAGLIAEEETGRPWPDLIVEDVLRPLGMERAFARTADAVAAGDVAASYGYTNVNTGRMGTVEAEETYDPAWARPAGLVWATPTEMLDFAAFLVDGNAEVLDDDLRREIVAEQVSTLYAGDRQHYGYGVMVDRGFNLADGWYDVPCWSHGGNTLSFTSHFYILPDQRFAISILSNGYGDAFTNSVATAFETLVDLPAPGEAPVDEIDLAALDEHAGAYLDAWNVGDVTIARDGDGLTISMPLLDELGYQVDPELVGISTDLWYVYVDGYPYDLTFVDGQDGEPSTYLRNRIFVATRVEEPPETSAAAPPAATPTAREQAAADPAAARARIDALLARARAADPSRTLAVPRPR